MMRSKQIYYTGTDEAPAERIALRAGPLSMIYEAGDLRYVKLGDHELVRRLYVAIRDRNWGTAVNQMSNVQMTVQEESFEIQYDVVNQHIGIDFRWHAILRGDAQGNLTCSMAGQAHSTFWRNRIGFCILQPSNVAGSQVVVEHVDGSQSVANLPTTINPDQPLLPFTDLRGFRQELGQGVQWVTRFMGDAFELEDQRNWTDASFKIFSTPLRHPYPVEIAQGTKIAQAFTLQIRGLANATLRSVAGERIVTFGPEINRVMTNLPRLGLGVATHDEPLTAQEVMRLQTLHLHHLRVDLPLDAPDYALRLEHATQQARTLGVELEVALLLPCEVHELATGELTRQLQHLRTQVDRLQPPVGVWLIFPRQEKYREKSPSELLLAAARQQLASYAPHARFFSGTNADFIFYNRFPTEQTAFDGLAITTNPTVHAIDDLSVMETMQTQAALVQSTRQLAGDKPVHISSITLKMRHNPYASVPPSPVPAGGLPPEVDVRQMSLFGAVWTLGSLKYISENGAASATYYETTGWRGVMERAEGAPVPEKFPSQPGEVFPLYHVLADVGDFAGGIVLPTRSSDALAVDGLWLQQEDRSRILLANVTDEPQQAVVTGLPSRVQMRTLDENTVAQAMHNPEVWRAEADETKSTTAGTLTLALLPYAIVRLDAVREEA